MQKIFTILFFLLFSFLNIKALGVVVSDIEVERGKTYELLVKSDITSNLISLEITFQYDATMLKLIKALGGNSYVLNNPENEIKVNLNPNDYTKSTFTIASSNVKYLASGLVCAIQFETSASSQYESFVDPIELKINNIKMEDFAPKKGKITNPSILIPTEVEYFRQNFPNPFDSYTRFPIQIIDSTSLEVLVYGVDGAFFAKIGNDESIIKSDMYDSKGTLLSSQNGKYFLPRGRYDLYLNPIPYNFPSGAYLIFFKTDKSIHHLNFNYVK